MSHVSPKSTNIGNQDDSRTHAEEASSQMPRVQEPRVDQEIIIDAVPINMVLPSEGSTKKKKTKRTTSKKRKEKALRRVVLPGSLQNQTLNQMSKHPYKHRWKQTLRSQSQSLHPPTLQHHQKSPSTYHQGVLKRILTKIKPYLQKKFQYLMSNHMLQHLVMIKLMNKKKFKNKGK
jgi:ADP-heptose:LPS heptosyltransferase